MVLKSFDCGLIFRFLIFLVWINSNLSFNLETRLPVIKRGSPNTYFGYSVAEHQSVDESNSPISWLLVGAPLGKNFQPETNRSGALFSCPITTVNENDCKQVITDGYNAEPGSSNTVYPEDLSEPNSDELKEGQWLGVTVRSQGRGKAVLVCAHRYVSKGDTYQLGVGLCYTLTQNLEYKSLYEICSGIDGSGDRSHETHGFCQLGTSGALLDGDMAIIGSPGTYTWSGGAFVVNISNVENKYIELPSRRWTSPVPTYSYLGMSVTGGKFLNANYTTYVAGAPRSNETGAVVLFSKSTDGSELLTVDAVLKGKQFASSFGYEVATADVNGDGLPDLLVGAPFYFEKNKGGAVYIYLNKKHCLTCSQETTLTGKPESRFGFAIANLGDINKDGFDDVAIGAPYEDDGKVYIYLGSPSGLSDPASQVICPASSKPLNGIKSFGYSLSGGMDLDGNGYPDLLIGAYESAAVVLLKARPIIELVSSVEPQKALREIETSKHGCPKDPDSKYTCFSFKACVTVQTVNKENRKLNLDGGDGLTLYYRLESDYRRTIKRVWLGSNSTVKPHSFQNNITLKLNPKNQLTHCQEHTVYIKDTAKDIHSPIDFKLNYELIQKEPVVPKIGESFPSVNHYPILNQKEAEKNFKATFLKECGPDDVCNSHLRIQASLDLPKDKNNISNVLIGQNDEVTVIIEVSNSNEPAYEAQLFFFHPENLFLKNYYDLSPSKSDVRSISCSHYNGTLIICDLGNPLKKSKPAKFYLKFDLPQQDLSSVLEFITFVNSTSNETEPVGPITLRAKVIKVAELSVTGSARPDPIYTGSVVREESTIRFTDEIGPRVQHTYQVFNKGPWRVHDLELNVEWPYEIAGDGKPLLYIDEQPNIEGTNVECLLPPKRVNDRNFRIGSRVETPSDTETKFSNNSNSAYSVTPHSQKWRNVETVKDSAGRSYKRYRLNCGLGTAKCFEFNCKIKLLEKNQEATIKIKARLWNSTLDFSDVDVIEISSRASLSNLPSGDMEPQDTKDDQFEVITTVKSEDLQLKPEEVDWWVYLLAIIIGLLLLTLLTYLLWRLGFFKRKRIEDLTLTGNLEKHPDAEECLM